MIGAAACAGPGTESVWEAGMPVPADSVASAWAVSDPAVPAVIPTGTGARATQVVNVHPIDVEGNLPSGYRVGKTLDRGTCDTASVKATGTYRCSAGHW